MPSSTSNPSDSSSTPPTSFSTTSSTSSTSQTSHESSFPHPPHKLSLITSLFSKQSSPSPTSASASSTPVLYSPCHQRLRTPSRTHFVRETLDARTEYPTNDDGEYCQLRINQYTLQREIGSGSYGAVHLAVDDQGQEFAMKEFSKSRLRRQAKTQYLRRSHPAYGGGSHGFTTSSRRTPSVAQIQADAEAQDRLFMIRPEIAVMKKLNHPNLVKLYEVLDDPREDSIFMALEMCHKGVIMKVTMGGYCTPFDEEQCRVYFRDLILGIEYLHSQGIVHRDIKPQNLLLSHDNILKIGDFGVSEMFEKKDRMITSKTVGSPAFLPPELCVAKPGPVSGTAVDIWSMGVTLYCLRFGQIPFDDESVVDMYTSIRTKEPKFLSTENPVLIDFLRNRLLDKNPETRIKMHELRNHAWVTLNGLDPLMSKAENCSHVLTTPDELEIGNAITTGKRSSTFHTAMRTLTQKLRGGSSDVHWTRNKHRLPKSAVPVSQHSTTAASFSSSSSSSSSPASSVPSTPKFNISWFARKTSSPSAESSRPSTAITSADASEKSYRKPNSPPHSSRQSTTVFPSDTSAAQESHPRDQIFPQNHQFKDHSTQSSRQSSQSSQSVSSSRFTHSTESRQSSQSTQLSQYSDLGDPSPAAAIHSHSHDSTLADQCSYGDCDPIHSHVQGKSAALSLLLSTKTDDPATTPAGTATPTAPSIHAPDNTTQTHEKLSLQIDDPWPASTSSREPQNLQEVAIMESPTAISSSTPPEGFCLSPEETTFAPHRRSSPSIYV